METSRRECQKMYAADAKAGLRLSHSVSQHVVRAAILNHSQAQQLLHFLLRKSNPSRTLMTENALTTLSPIPFHAACKCNTAADVGL